MSRRRYISTEISVDRRINQLSDFAALLYTWMIPHAEDDGTITADVDEIAWVVVPGRKRGSKVVQSALNEMFDLGLLIPCDSRLVFPFGSFYKYQSYIPPAKRRTSDPDAIERRETPKITASPSPSPSPSPSKHMAEKLDGFDDFWVIYPRKVKKGYAKKCWLNAVKKVEARVIISNLERQLPTLKKQEMQYILHPSTWLNGECWTDELDTDGRVSGPARVFTPAEETVITAALALYRAGEVEKAQYRCYEDEYREDLWLEAKRRGKT